MIMDQIEKLGIGGHTYLIYMSDNGAGGNRGVLRGGKGSLWEGGIRVPLIIQGPGIEPNTLCHERVVGFDLFPTLCELGGVSQPLPAGIEGGSITSLLFGSKGAVERPYGELVFHFPHYQSADGPHSAIVQGDLKLIKFYETDDVRLYDLVNDIGEQNDLSKDMGEKAMHLRERLEQYLDSVDAQMPVPNPNYGTNKSTDFNGDGQIDLEDFLEFARAYGSEEARFDLDNSGRVDFADFLKFVQDFGSAGG